MEDERGPDWRPETMADFVRFFQPPQSVLDHIHDEFVRAGEDINYDEEGHGHRHPIPYTWLGEGVMGPDSLHARLLAYMIEFNDLTLFLSSQRDPVNHPELRTFHVVPVFVFLSRDDCRHRFIPMVNNAIHRQGGEFSERVARMLDLAPLERGMLRGYQQRKGPNTPNGPFTLYGYSSFKTGTQWVNPAIWGHSNTITDPWLRQDVGDVHRQLALFSASSFLVPIPGSRYLRTTGV